MKFLRTKSRKLPSLLTLKSEHKTHVTYLLRVGLPSFTFRFWSTNSVNETRGPLRPSLMNSFLHFLYKHFLNEIIIQI